MVTERLQWRKSALTPIGSPSYLSRYGESPALPQCRPAGSIRRLAVIAASVFATRRAMSPKPIRRSRNAETAISLAALSAVGAPPPERSASIARPSAGKRSRSARSKVNRPSAARSGASDPGRDSIGIGQAMRNRGAHVRRRHTGDQRSVGEGDEPMHDRLRMHDDIEPVGWQAEQMVRLDQFESLVHQTRRIDRHLRPHHPVGVGERFLAGGGGNALGAPFSERSAGSGDGHRLNGARIASPRSPGTRRCARNPSATP